MFDITWNGSAFFAGATNSSENPIIVRSVDGITWTVVTVLNTITDIRYVPVTARRILPNVGVIPFTSNSSGGGGALPNLTINEVSGTSQTLASSNWNQYFYVTNSGFNSLTLPATTATSNAGNYWTIRNATNSYLSVTLTNTLSLTSPLVIPPSNATTLAVSGVSSNTILLL
jgi:hypothetical protein